MFGRRFEEPSAWLGGGLKARVASYTILRRLVGGSEASWRRLGGVLDASWSRFGDVCELPGRVFSGLGRGIVFSVNFLSISSSLEH